MKAHGANSIQPLISSVECNASDAFDASPGSGGDDYRGIKAIGPDPDRKRGNILIHGVGGVGGLEGCLAPGTKTGAGAFNGSWEAMHFLMTVAESEPVVLRVLNNPKVA